MSTTDYEEIGNVRDKSVQSVILVTGAIGHVGRHVVSQEFVKLFGAADR
jgi:hypothetical protein